MGVVTSSCKPNCNCGRGETKGSTSRVQWSRQNYDVPGGGSSDPNIAFAEEPLEGDIWDAGVKNGTKDSIEDPNKISATALSAPAAEKFSEGDALLKDGLDDPGNSNTTHADTTEANLTPANVEISLQADSTDAPPPADAPKEDDMAVDGQGTERHMSMNLKQAVKKVMLTKHAGGKVATENKIGEKPVGWFKDLALELQRGIAAEGRRQTQSGFQAPESDYFTRCRIACGFPPVRYFATMGLQDGRTEPSLVVIGSQNAAGKSGAFFFLSPDQQLIAKSCTAEDWTTLLKVLPSYTEFMERARKNADENTASKRITSDGSGSVRGFIETLLPRFLGLYSLTLGDDPKPVRVLVMANVFGGAMTIDRKYDLKGSRHGRQASKKERSKKSPVYKDLDWIDKEKPLGLSECFRTQLMASIKTDLDWLAKHGLMDYSLLVGVHVVQEDAPSVYEAMNVVTLRDQTRLCYLGIIDVLTPYLFRKRAETFFMGKLVCGRDISCQHPKVYARRFARFVDDSVFEQPTAD